MADKALMVVPDPDILGLVGVPQWCEEKHIVVAWALGAGCTKDDAAEAGGVCRQTVYDWLNHRDLGGEYRAFVDRVSLHAGIMTRGARAREVNRLYVALTGEDMDLDRALRKSDAVTLLRVADELGGGDGVGVPLAARGLQPIIIGTQINTGAVTVMSGSPSPESAGGEGGDVVDGEVIDLAGEPEHGTSGE